MLEFLKERFAIRAVRRWFLVFFVAAVVSTPIGMAWTQVPVGRHVPHALMELDLGWVWLYGPLLFLLFSPPFLAHLACKHGWIDPAARPSGRGDSSRCIRLQ